MKIIGVDNYDREHVADQLWIDNIPNTSECIEFANRICDKLNLNLTGGGLFHKVVADDHKLWRGTEEII